MPLILMEEMEIKMNQMSALWRNTLTMITWMIWNCKNMTQKINQPIGKKAIPVVNAR